MSSKRSVEDVKEHLRRDALAFQKVFTSPEGVRVLERLEYEFCGGAMFDREHPHAVHYNVGRHDVVQHIKQMITIGAKLDD